MQLKIFTKYNHASQIFLTLFKNVHFKALLYFNHKEADYAKHITTRPLGFSDLPTAQGHKGSPQDNSQLVQSLLIIYNMLPCSSLLTKENPTQPTKKSDSDDNFEKLYLILRFFL